MSNSVRQGLKRVADEERIEVLSRLGFDESAEKRTRQACRRARLRTCGTSSISSPIRSTIQSCRSVQNRVHLTNLTFEDSA